MAKTLVENTHLGSQDVRPWEAGDDVGIAQPAEALIGEGGQIMMTTEAHSYCSR